MTTPLRIGARGSTLARVQAAIVAAALGPLAGPTETVSIETDGDRRQPDRPSGEGDFVRSIEAAVRDGTVDLAVHSAKDLPTDRGADSELVIAAYLTWADPRDALVTQGGGRSLATLPAEASVGTDSPRRAGFILAVRPDLRVRDLAGNVDSRLRRLDEGDVDAIVLAVAGLARLELIARIDEALDPSVVPPAAGQGALAVQVRRRDAALVATVRRLDHAATCTAVEAERAVLGSLGGGCRSPIGTLASTTAA
ncbi:MAG: hydroxymethylbilane synthase [Chloroflexi bacterium]|nr:hydroxymethylbilane synthase [Chloroflexota bacterium]